MTQIPKIVVPDNFKEDEKLVRIIFSPFHIDKKNPTKITHIAFRSPSGIDEVSVNRLNFTTATFCKNQGQAMNSEAKTFSGLASIRHAIVLDLGAYVRITKQETNPFHADIYYGIILQKGEPAPAELNLILKNLARKAYFYPDTHLNSNNWEGEDVNNC